MKKVIEYSYIRSEADNTYTVFLSGDSAWINKNIDISLNENHELVVLVPRLDFVSNHVPQSVFSYSPFNPPENEQNECLSKNQNESLGGLTPMSSNNTYVTSKMPDCLLSQLQRLPTRFILCNADADFLSEFILPPLGAYLKSDLGVGLKDKEEEKKDKEEKDKDKEKEKDTSLNRSYADIKNKH